MVVHRTAAQQVSHIEQQRNKIVVDLINSQAACLRTHARTHTHGCVQNADFGTELVPK